MERKASGQYTTISTVGGEVCKAFVPDPLPPTPALEINPELQGQLDRALIALGRLDSISTLLPDASLFLYMYIRKEAVLSSQIEGTQSSLSDLLKFENAAAPGVPMDDVREVSNYVMALDYGMQKLQEGLPISLRLIRGIHRMLLSHGRGAERDPGEFRKSQNWIGGTRPGNAAYIPPPPDKVPELMGQLEKFVHDEPVKTPMLIKAALAHVQFESIHPFLDGNGRLGRLLITLLLCTDGALTDPTLYLSLYFKSHRQQYYDLLQNVRVRGEWEEWVSFFLAGVEQTAGQAVQTAKRLVDLFAGDRRKIESAGKAAGSALRVHHVLQRKPILTVTKTAEETSLSYPTAAKSLELLAKLGIVMELPKSGRGKLYGYTEYIGILNEGTEPL